KDHASPSVLKGAAPLQKDHASESSVDENVPPAEILQSATVLDGHAIEEVASVNPDGTGLRALLVMGMLRVFVHVSDILGERKNLDAFGLAFYYLSALHVITVAKLFTIEDILCLSDSLIAVGVLVSSRIEIEPLGKDDRHGALVKKVAVVVCGYLFVILVVCFKYATVPYGNQPEEPAAGARADESGQAGDRAA
ncbi:unnamed protein product, partial [Brassica rapa subsp. trilocularis]